MKWVKFNIWHEMVSFLSRYSIITHVGVGFTVPNIKVISTTYTKHLMYHVWWYILWQAFIMAMPCGCQDSNFTSQLLLAQSLPWLTWKNGRHLDYCPSVQRSHLVNLIPGNHLNDGFTTQWKPRFIQMPTLSPPVTSVVLVLHTPIHWKPSHHKTNFLVNDGTYGSHNDNLCFHQWQQRWHHDNSQFSTNAESVLTETHLHDTQCPIWYDLHNAWST